MQTEQIACNRSRAHAGIEKINIDTIRLSTFTLVIKQCMAAADP